MTKTNPKWPQYLLQTYPPSRICLKPWAWAWVPLLPCLLAFLSPEHFSENLTGAEAGG